MVDIAHQAVQSQNFGLATEIYDRILREKGPTAEILFELAKCLAHSGRLSESLTAYLKAFRLGRGKLEVLSPLSKALVKLTRERMEAVNGEDNSLQLDTKKILDSEPFHCGICRGTVREPTTIFCGHTFCKTCLDKNGHNVCVACGDIPSDTEYKHNILLMTVTKLLFPNQEEFIQQKSAANNAVREGNFSQAASLYSAMLETHKNDHTVWSNRSYAQYNGERFHEALDDAMEAIRLRPQWAKGYYRRGVAEEALGRTQEAAISFMKCLALDKTACEADSRLTQILYKLLEPTMAVEDLKRIPVASKEPMSDLLASSDAGDDTRTGLEKLKSLLDTQFKECDTAAQLLSQVDDIDPSPLNADMFECPLCYRLLHCPVTTPCGHVFCQHCLHRSMDHSMDCPQCRGSLSSYVAHRHKAVTMSIQRILQLWFSKEVDDREKVHQEEITSFTANGPVAEIPIFVCTIAFPTVPCPLHIFEPRYRLMMRQVMESGVRQFGMCMCTDEDDETQYSEYGTMLEICDIKFFPDGRSVVDTVGGRRFRVISKSMKEGYHIARVEFLDEVKVDGNELNELNELSDHTYELVSTWLNNLPRRILTRIFQRVGQMPEKENDVQSARFGPKWSWWVTAILPIEPRIQLTMLSMNSLKDRLNAINGVLSYISRPS